MNYYEHHLGDYLRDTAHLSMVEDGAYRRLLDTYYVKEQPLPLELRDVYRLVRASTKPERDAVAIVLREFFQETPEGWRHKRCDTEIAKYQESAPDREAKRESERERQRRTRERRAHLFDVLREHGVVPAYDTPMSELQRLASHIESRPVTRDGHAPVTRDATATHTHSPYTSNTPHTPTGVRFAEFWANSPASPRKVGKAACEKAWKTRKLDDVADAILAHVAAMKHTDQWQRGFKPAPQTYLNQRRWEDGEPGAADLLAGDGVNRV